MSPLTTPHCSTFSGGGWESFIHLFCTKSQLLLILLLCAVGLAVSLVMELHYAPAQTQTKKKNQSLSYKTYSPSTSLIRYMEVHGHSLSIPLIWNQGQFDLTQRWVLWLEVLYSPFASHPAGQRRLPCCVATRQEFSGCIYLLQSKCGHCLCSHRVSFGRRTGAYPPGKPDTPSSLIRVVYTNRNNTLQVHVCAVFLSPSVFHYSACFCCWTTNC